MIIIASGRWTERTEEEEGNERIPGDYNLIGWELVLRDPFTWGSLGWESEKEGRRPNDSSEENQKEKKKKKRLKGERGILIGVNLSELFTVLIIFATTCIIFDKHNILFGLVFRGKLITSNCDEK